MAQNVPPSDIESELEKIWDSLEGTNKMRACLFNLIIYGKKGQRAGYLDSLIKKMIQKFPSRIIFVTFDPEKKENSLQTSVSIMTADEGESELVCDLINIDVSGESKKQIPFLILPHILPDLPVYLVHADDPCSQDPLSYKIELFATRVIYDSEATSNLPLFAKTILQHKQKANCQIADLNWARIESWRNLFADTFQTAEHLQDLRRAKTLRFIYNSSESDYYCHTRIQSVFLQAWVACQLGWTLTNVQKEGEKTLFHYTSEHGKVTAELIPEKIAELPPGRIINVEITTYDEIIYSFFRKKELLHHVIVDRSTSMSCSLPNEFIFDKDETGLSLVKEVCHTSTSAHFLRVLNLLSSIKDAELC